MEESEVVPRCFLKPGEHPLVVLDRAEETFDQMTFLVDMPIARTRRSPVRLGRDHRCNPALFQGLDQGIGKARHFDDSLRNVNRTWETSEAAARGPGECGGDK